jgi:hypothetical protein
MKSIIPTFEAMQRLIPVIAKTAMFEDKRPHLFFRIVGKKTYFTLKQIRYHRRGDRYG